MTFHSLHFWNKATAIENESAFNECAVELFRYQAEHVSVYKEFLQLLAKDTTAVKHYSEIPFLPVALFKSRVVTDQPFTPSFFFLSSGTTVQTPAKHYLADTGIYDESLLKSFQCFFGDPGQYCFLALLPTYLERPGASLVYMMERLIQSGGHPQSGFYLHNYRDLANRIKLISTDGSKIFLLGVTYALLDFFDAFPMQLTNAIVMETGGMKGRRTELVKKEVHRILSGKTGLAHIHSEYGMTELLSQAYSYGDGIFSCPPWMKILVGDVHDPLSLIPRHETGTIKVIDLANIHSCAFLETQDLGRIVGENEFEVLGRMDNSELRGCNLMIG